MKPLTGLGSWGYAALVPASFKEESFMGTDDGSFLPVREEDIDRFIDVISLSSRRVSLAVMSAGFALAGASMVAANNASLYGRVGLGLAVLLGGWAAAAHRG